MRATIATCLDRLDYPQRQMVGACSRRMCSLSRTIARMSRSTAGASRLTRMAFLCITRWMSASNTRKDVSCHEQTRTADPTY